MWNLLAKGAKGAGSWAVKHPTLSSGLIGTGFTAADAWGGPESDDHEQFQKAMEQLHAEGLMKNEDGTGGPIDPNEMWDFWHNHSWHSKHKAAYWGGKAMSAATGFIPYAGFVLPFAVDHMMDKQVDNSDLIDVIRSNALDYKNKTLNSQLQDEEPIQEDENYEEEQSPNEESE